jgi:DNA-binding transcriptional regulator YiaG
MAKKTIKNYTTEHNEVRLAQEPMVAYVTTMPLFTQKKSATTTKAFTYKHFKKIADKIDFNNQDWADLLFISERTLQRYAKSNSEFNGLQVERILLLQKVIDSGNEIFGKNFAKWLKEPSFKYNGDTPYSMLFTYGGIVDVIRYIGQLEWGVLP